MNHDQHMEHTHDKHAGHSPEMFRSKFWISLLLTVPVVLYSDAIQQWLHVRMPAFPGSQWVPLVFGTILFFYGGSIFLKGAVTELQDRLPGMMTLISLAITVAFVYSVATSFFLPGMGFFWELATLITIMLFGHWMEMRSVMSAQSALHELAKLLPDQAEVIAGETTRQVPLSALRVGDLVLVRPGAQVPTDGMVVEGTSDVNESMLTGESRPVEKEKGSTVVGGTINGDGPLRVKVTKVGEATALAGIMRLIQEAQTSKSRTQILADRAAFYLTIIALSVGFITLASWLVFSSRGINFALERTVTVLVIACPHALGLAIPLVTAISTTLAARNGLLVRQRMALENARNISVVLFDKTGTLTKGEQGVVSVWAAGKQSERDVLTLAAAVERESEHIIARAIISKAQQEQLTLPKATGVKALPGRGVEASINGQVVRVGGPQLLLQQHVVVPEALQKVTAQASAEGKTIVYALTDSTIAGALALADVIRPESYTAVKQLQESGVGVAMLTGDSKDVATWVARELGITEYFADVLPQYKAAIVKQLQQDGSRVAMVGDGVNDAPALVQADIGIAIGAGTDVAIESAGIVLASSDPQGVVKILRLSRASYQKMVQNLLWATGYNALAIPLAAGVLAPLGIILAPAVGAILMSLSTVIVAVNAQFLRNVRLA